MDCCCSIYNVRWGCCAELWNLDLETIIINHTAFNVTGIADLVLPLSSDPTLGVWSIILTHADDEFDDETVTFTVEEYGKCSDVTESHVTYVATCSKRVLD